MALLPRLTEWYNDNKKSYQIADKLLLLNLYKGKKDLVAWHRDKESRNKKLPVIASTFLR